VEDLQVIAEKEVNGVDIIRTFLKRQVQPLQARAHPMFLYAGGHDPTRESAEELSRGDLDRVLRPLLKYKGDEDLPGKSLTAPFSASRPVPQELKVAGMMPPLPENFPIAPDNEVVDSESDLLPAQSPIHEAPEVSEGQTRKRAQSLSESSDASTPPTPRVPSFLERHGEDDGASSAPIPAMPVRAMAPQPRAKKKKRKKERAPPVFNLSDIDS